MGHTVNLIRRAIIIKSQDRISSLQRTMAIVAIFQMRLSSRVRAKEIKRLHASKLNNELPYSTLVNFSHVNFFSGNSVLLLNPVHCRYHVDRLCEQKLPILNPGF